MRNIDISNKNLHRLFVGLIALVLVAGMTPTNTAHASLIGVDVTVELVGATDSGENPKTAEVLEFSGPEFVWQTSVACGMPDEFVSVDIEESRILVILSDGTGTWLFCW